MPNRL